MLQLVQVGEQSVESYRQSAGGAAVDRLRELAADLRGARVCHLNATPYGGGVAEILRSEVPLLRDLGISADWRVITGDAEFFRVTKAIHNGLQGATGELSAQQRELYLTHAARNATLLEERYDLVVVHDPQPLAIPSFGPAAAGAWIWRCHIDTSAPNPAIWAFLRPYLAGYAAAVFTLAEFVPPDLDGRRVALIAPAIDPRSPKNLELRPEDARAVLEWIGVDVDRPLVVQVSRFDPWKDPLGVIAAYRLVKPEHPGLQLALVGSMALDDPEGWDVYRQISAEAERDPDLTLFTNLTGVGNIEVNAFQRLADVAIQKSIREGFGLVVSETLWKGTPVVAGRAGGIPLQMPQGVGGFLVDSVEECAARVHELLGDPEEARRLAAAGRERVRERFLLPRLVADDLRLYAAVIGGRGQLAAPTEARAAEAPAGAP